MQRGFANQFAVASDPWFATAALYTAGCCGAYTRAGDVRAAGGQIVSCRTRPHNDGPGPDCGTAERHMARLRTLIVFVIQSATAGLAAAFVAVYLFPGLLPERLARPAATPTSYAGAVAATAPAVVNLIAADGQPAADGAAAATTLRAGDSLGSGVVMSPDGYVITNDHVIAGAAAIDVVLNDGRVAPATIVGTDPDTDLALLRIELDDLPGLRLGRSDTLRVGDVVLAIGNPFSIGQTVTQGIVSGTRRGQLGLSPFENFIQTDAAINPGNSGGALVDGGSDPARARHSRLAGRRHRDADPRAGAVAGPARSVRHHPDQRPAGQPGRQGGAATG